METHKDSATAILLCRWIHCIETHGSRDAPTEAEAQLIDQVKAVLNDTDRDYEEGRSLAAAVATAWASLNNDVSGPLLLRNASLPRCFKKE